MLAISLIASFASLLNDPTLDNEWIELKGYLYRNSDEEVILAEQPNLRSCCLDKERIAKIILKGDFPKQLPSQATKVKGRLNHHQLEEVKIISNQTFNYSLLIFTAILTGGFLLYRKAFKKFNNLNHFLKTRWE